MKPLFNQHSEAYIIDPHYREAVSRSKGPKLKDIVLILIGVVEQTRARLEWLVDTDVTLVRPV